MLGALGAEDIAAKTEVEAAFQAWRKSVAKVSEQFCRKLEPEEVDTLVQTPRRNDQAAGDRQRIHQEGVEQLSGEMKSVSDL